MLSVPCTNFGCMEQWSGQMSFDELGEPLHQVTFVVVDLETTGGSPTKGSRITEIGAVKVRGGEVLGEFQTLINPLTPIPAFITGLTGITDEMVLGAPTIDAVLPSFLEFARGSVLVAHNAPFDIGFLKHFAAEQWPRFEVIDTVRLARQVLTQGESPNYKLSSLASLFRAESTPDHRALSDARATMDVLHGLIARVGGQGVHTLEELKLFNSRVSPAIRRKRHLAEHLPNAPGVYLFKDRADRVLYVGTSSDLRKRVRSYFTGAEKRTRIRQMVTIASRVDTITCSTTLEAGVRELRLISAQLPPYNSRGRRQGKLHWLKITNEPWPRLSIVRTLLDDGADYFGPFTSRSSADDHLSALHETFLIRRCNARLGKVASGSPCMLKELGRCLSPCDGSTSPASYAAEIDKVRATFHGSPDRVVESLDQRMSALGAEGRFEEAAVQRDRLIAFIRNSTRIQRLQALVSCEELVATQQDPSGAWVVHVIRHGRLAGAATIPARATVAVRRSIEDLRLSSESVSTDPRSALAASPEESELILNWLEQPGIRLVRVHGHWSSPANGAGRWSSKYDAFEESRRLVAAF